MARPFCNSLKKEFLRGNVWLDGIPSSQLCTSRWHPQGHVWYLAWRAFAAAYFSAWVIGIGVHSGARAHPPDGGKWLIYLTNVTGILLAAYFCMALYAAAISTWKGDHGNEDSTTGDALGEGEHHQLMCSPPHLPLGYRLVWAHRTAAFTSSALVVLLYWALIHEGNVWTAINLHMHGGGTSTCACTVGAHQPAHARCQLGPCPHRPGGVVSPFPPPPHLLRLRLVHCLAHLLFHLLWCGGN
eukprot:jgi/Mesvir1/5021/Mv02233-RA.1